MRPSFVIAGAPRAGTTWLYSNLSKHPDVFLTPNKEPRYYSVNETDRLSFTGPGDERWLSHLVQDRDSYEALYSGARPEQLRGEASSDYLYRSQVAAARLHSDVPSARIVFILRNPAYRAYSNWLQHVQYGREPLSFGEALDAEEERIGLGWAWWWHYAKRGFYSEQLEPFLDAFPSDQVLIVLHDELKRDPQGLLEKVCGFLEIDPVVDDQVEKRKNHSLVPRSPAHRTARRLLKPAATASRRLLPKRAEERMRRWYHRKTLGPSMSDADYLRLRRTFSQDTERLAGMTGLDLSAWLG
jgi:Sulfotransferase family